MYKLETLTVGDVVVTLRPRSMLTEETEFALKAQCLQLLTQTTPSANGHADELVIQPILDEFGINQDDMYYMTAYLWILSPRIAQIEGADFELLQRLDSPEIKLDKIRRFMASQCIAEVRAIDKAITALDAPADPSFGEMSEDASEDEKKSGSKKKARSTTGSKDKSSTKKEPSSA